MTGDGSPREEEPMIETGVTEDAALVEPVPVGPGESTGESVGEVAATNGAADDAVPVPPVRAEADASLLALIDRLAATLERGDLGELEVASGGTTIVLRAPAAIERAAAAAPPLAADASSQVAEAQQGAAGATDAAAPPPATTRPSVKAPLTGIYYGAPSPGATAYVAVGDHVSVGQIIGLIEAMKLFNEIKSDLAGRVTRICADNGALVKAKQPLIEVEPA
jgi:acetyl-CoA carboxylase biotin carboxyl carrier protein